MQRTQVQVPDWGTKIPQAMGQLSPLAPTKESPDATVKTHVAKKKKKKNDNKKIKMQKIKDMVNTIP